MKKSELYALFIGAANALVNAQDKERMSKLIEEHLKPKTGGARANFEDTVKKDAAGKITHVKCQLSGKWFPATIENFYEDKTGKSKIVVIENGKQITLRRLSRKGESAYKTWQRGIKAKLAEKYNALLEAKNPAEIANIQKQITELKAQKIDWDKAFEAINKPKEAPKTEAK